MFDLMQQVPTNEMIAQRVLASYQHSGVLPS
jgi:hypothetical protein